MTLVLCAKGLARPHIALGLNCHGRGGSARLATREKAGPPVTPGRAEEAPRRVGKTKRRAAEATDRALKFTDALTKFVSRRELYISRRDFYISRRELQISRRETDFRTPTRIFVSRGRKRVRRPDDIRTPDGAHRPAADGSETTSRDTSSLGVPRLPCICP